MKRNRGQAKACTTNRRELVQLSRLGTHVSVPLTFAEAAAVQEKIEFMEDGVPRAVLARVLAAFVTNPTSQRYVRP